MSSLSSVVTKQSPCEHVRRTKRDWLSEEASLGGVGWHVVEGPTLVAL